MRELDAATFDDAIAAGAVVVDFWAPWCKPCRAVETILCELEAGSAAAFVKLNIDEHPDIAARYDVLSIPTVIAFAAGVQRGSLVGARPRAHVERWLAEVLPAGELEGLAVHRQLDA
ncbi:MAG TPA: thioredoxin domain-containing protein [Gaiellaceae bacterium]|jgi:thioredoxin 1|nr:thioredoxin domain-containing protein [Gaiellaceae bacterium]